MMDVSQFLTDVERAQKNTDAPAGSATAPVAQRPKVQWENTQPVVAGAQQLPADASAAPAQSQPAPGTPGVPPVPAPASRPKPQFVQTGAPDAIAPAGAGNPAANQANTPLTTDAASATGRQELIQQLAAQLRNTDEAGRKGLRADLRRAGLSLYDPKYELSEKDLQHLMPDQRRIVLAYQRVFMQLGQGLGGKAENDLELLQNSVEELFDQLSRQKGEFAIKTGKLCSKVNGYGQYEPMSGSFVAGRQNPTIVYTELDNFASEAAADGRHEVRLSQQIVLFTESDGLAVWRQKPIPIVDRSFNRRRDFFTVQLIYLPATLSVGRYSLSVSITDQVGQRVDEIKIPIHVLATEEITSQQ